MIIDALPASNMSIASTIDLSLLNVTPTDLYVADNRLVVIGSVDNDILQPYEEAKPAAPQSKMSAIMPWRGGTQMTKVLVYDISDPKNPTLNRDFEVEGYQLSSRRIGQSLVLVTNKATWNWYSDDTETVLPMWKDNQKDYQHVQATDVRYYPGFHSANWLIISTIALNNAEKPASLYTILGAGSTMYATPDALYLVTQNWNGPMLWRRGVLDIADYTETTDVLKFALTDGVPEAVAKGTVPGRI
jgi:inhibitor of cysteine peptidase